MSNEELILDSIHEMCEAHKMAIKGIQLNIEATATVQGKDIAAIKEHLEKQNDSIEKLWTESDARQLVVDEFKDFKRDTVKELEKRAKVVGTIKKKWYLIALGLIIFTAIVNLLLEIFGVRTLIEFFINKI